MSLGFKWKKNYIIAVFLVIIDCMIKNFPNMSPILFHSLPGVISDPVRVNTQLSGSSLHMMAFGSTIIARIRQNITMIAFLNKLKIIGCYKII